MNCGLVCPLTWNIIPYISYSALNVISQLGVVANWFALNIKLRGRLRISVFVGFWSTNCDFISGLCGGCSPRAHIWPASNWLSLTSLGWLLPPHCSSFLSSFSWFLPHAGENQVRIPSPTIGWPVCLWEEERGREKASAHAGERAESLTSMASLRPMKFDLKYNF